MARSVLHLIRTLDPAVGGPADYLRTLASSRTLLTHANTGILTLDGPATEWWPDSRIQVFKAGPAHGNYGFATSLRSKMIKAAKAFDILVIHGLWQFHGAMGAAVAQSLGKPYFVFPHGMLDPWFRKAFPLKHIKKQLYWIARERSILRHAEGVLFTSRQESVAAEGTFQPRADYKDFVCPLGVQPPPTHLEAALHKFYERFPHLQGKRFLLFLGKLNPKNGCENLVKAIRGYPVELVMAGPSCSNQYLNYLKSLAPISKVTFTNLVQGDLKRGALAAADAFILPSCQENFGMTAAEALASGLPVLITNRVNISEDVRSYGAGLVEEPSLEGTSRLIRSWLEQGSRSMKVAARRCFADRFDIEMNAERLLQIFQSASETSGRSNRAYHHDIPSRAPVPVDQTRC